MRRRRKRTGGMRVYASASMDAGLGERDVPFPSMGDVSERRRCTRTEHAGPLCAERRPPPPSRYTDAEDAGGPQRRRCTRTEDAGAPCAQEACASTSSVHPYRRCGGASTPSVRGCRRCGRAFRRWINGTAPVGIRYAARCGGSSGHRVHSRSLAERRCGMWIEPGCSGDGHRRRNERGIRIGSHARRRIGPHAGGRRRPRDGLRQFLWRPGWLLPVPSSLEAHEGGRFRQSCENQANLPGSTTTVALLEACARAFRADCTTSASERRHAVGRFPVQCRFRPAVPERIVRAGARGRRGPCRVRHLREQHPAGAGVQRRREQRPLRSGFSVRRSIEHLRRLR